MRRVDGTLPNLEVFCRTFETGSFTKASGILGLTPQAASRAVARLETDLGVVLFRRTTRSLSPTDEARRYYARAHAALALLAEGEREISHGRRSPSGIVHVSMPTTYGHHRLLPSLGRFRELYPDVEIESHVSNRNVDFVRESFDLSIRMGEITRQVSRLPKGLMSSLTWDRGAEMADHGKFTVATKANVYFCGPSSPWQRATNENTNGLLRQYFPRRTDLSNVTQRELNRVARQMNMRPRKILSYGSPAEALCKQIALTG